MSARWNENRKIARRILIRGRLTLITPARFGGGEDGPVTDMPILRDAQTRQPLLPGSSIAGAMRAYLRERLQGYEESEPDNVTLLSQKLFGDVLEKVPENQRASLESYLTIEDALAENAFTELRPGVKIDPATRIAAFEEDKGGQLFNMELLEPGTHFDLNMELDLPEDEELQNELLEGLAIALSGFEKGEIGLGARKRRGFGECKVDEWKVQTYNLKKPAELVDWIEGKPGKAGNGATVSDKLGVKHPLRDRRKYFRMEAEFKLSTSLLIRSGTGQNDSPDMVHLRSGHGDNTKSILSGTSLAGAMRARGLKIANTLFGDQDKAKTFVMEIFGPDKLERQEERRDQDAPFASRLLVREREVQGRTDLVQSRIRIDRFTGGTFPGALFDQQPLVGGDGSRILISIELRNPEDAQIGLLLHILKDLWVGDLALGGESSAGRGRLAGVKADLSLHLPGQEKPEVWQITPQPDGRLLINGEQSRLNDYAVCVGGAK